ncbi:MAG: DUF202 domain-containing protein [Candidatus Aenigmarchaeota archaeon]|nr:DUF202 domain-containing protein [Candidatus Aenigmarchaeota archaeon]
MANGKNSRNILFSEEQTLLSRERTMHSYIQTGLTTIGVGLIMLKFFVEFYLIGILLTFVGFATVAYAINRWVGYRKTVKIIRGKENI